MESNSHGVEVEKMVSRAINLERAANYTAEFDARSLEDMEVLHRGDGRKIVIPQGTATSIKATKGRSSICMGSAQRLGEIHEASLLTAINYSMTKVGRVITRAEALYIPEEFWRQVDPWICHALHVKNSVTNSRDDDEKFKKLKREFMERCGEHIMEIHPASRETIRSRTGCKPL